MNCLPFLGHKKWEVFLMRVDLRVKHDVETRRLAAALFADGLGCAAVAKNCPFRKRPWENGSRYTARSEARCC